MSERIFIVGGEGFVGSHIARQCALHGQTVTTFGPRPGVDLLADVASTIARVHGSAEDFPALCEAVRACGPDVIVWAAGFNKDAQGLLASGETDAAAALAVNVGAWANVLRAAVQFKVSRVVACGSTVVFGAATDYPGPVHEDSPHLPRTIYGLSKSLAELTAQHYARLTPLRIVTLRLPLVFGPGRWYGGAAAAIVRLVEAAAHNAPIELSAPTDAFDLIYVKDAARAVRALLSAPRVAPVYHVNGFTTSYVEIANLLRRLRAGFSPRLNLTPSAWSYPLMSASRIDRELGFRPEFNLESALTDYLKEL